MPELPEVESVVSSLKPHIINSTINDIKIHKGGESLLGTSAPGEMTRVLVGEKISSIERRGKYIIFSFASLSSPLLVVHLRMTGRFTFASQKGLEILPRKLVSDGQRQRLAVSGLPPYVRIELSLDNGTLYFSDVRRFATFHLTPSLGKYKGLAQLGPEALDPGLTAEALRALLAPRKKNVYSALLDQTIIAGLGNIYVCEVLARSRIHPLRPARAVTLGEAERLLDNIRKVLLAAIAAQGTTFRDYRTGQGSKGGYQHKLIVYGKKQTTVDGQDYEVKKLKIGGRGAYYIPELQS